MRWGLFALTLLGVFVLATGLFAFLNRPELDLFLTFALICALVAPPHDGRLAGWVVGFAQDLGTTGPLGIHALSLGLAALIATSLRDLVNVFVWPARLAVCVLAALPATLLVVIHRHAWMGLQSESWPWLVGGALLTSLVTASLATIITALPRLAHAARRRRHFAPARR